MPGEELSYYLRKYVRTEHSRSWDNKTAEMREVSFVNFTRNLLSATDRLHWWWSDTQMRSWRRLRARWYLQKEVDKIGWQNSGIVWGRGERCGTFQNSETVVRCAVKGKEEFQMERGGGHIWDGILCSSLLSILRNVERGEISWSQTESMSENQTETLWLVKLERLEGL